METKTILKAMHEDIMAGQIGEKKISLGQLDSLLEGVTTAEWFNKNYDYTFEELYTALKGISQKQKSYIWHCIYTKKYMILGNLLKSAGITPNKKI